VTCYPGSLTGHRGRNPEPNEAIAANLARRGKLRHDDNEEHCGSNDVGGEIRFVSHASEYRHHTTSAGIDFARQSRPLDRDESQFVVDRHTKGPLKPAEQISTHNAARARRRRPGPDIRKVTLQRCPGSKPNELCNSRGHSIEHVGHHVAHYHHHYADSRHPPDTTAAADQKGDGDTLNEQRADRGERCDKS
jgi:hypothetical protein